MTASSSSAPTAVSDAPVTLTADEAKKAQAAIAAASGKVASAIADLVALGDRAPAVVRLALGPLGGAFAVLGDADPSIPWSARGPDDNPF